MITPEQAESLFRAGTGVMLVVLVVAIFAAGARGIWAWGRELRGSLAREDLLRAENAALRTSLDANTEAGKVSTAAFVKALDDIGDRFEREFERLSDDVRRGPGSGAPTPRQRSGRA